MYLLLIQVNMIKNKDVLIILLQIHLKNDQKNYNFLIQYY